MTTLFRPTRREVMSAGAIAAGGALSACGGFDRSLLRAADAQPEGYPTVLAVQEMGRLLADRSDGRLRIKTYAGGQLGNEKDTLEITLLGGLDLNRVSIAPLGSIAPEAIVPTLPFLFRSTQHMRAALDGPPGDAILDTLKPHKLVGLCFYDAGARSFYTVKKPIREPEDLHGQKIRVMNSDIFVSMVGAFGGDATPMSYGEVYQGLLQGVVDGAENNPPSYESSRHFEVAKYYSLTRHVMAPEVLLMSLHRWNKLAEADRSLIRACARDSVAYMRRIWDERTQAAEADLVAQGVEIIEPDQAAFAALARPVWDKYLTTPEARALAAAIEETGAGDD